MTDSVLPDNELREKIARQIKSVSDYWPTPLGGEEVPQIAHALLSLIRLELAAAERRGAEKMRERAAALADRMDYHRVLVGEWYRPKDYKNTEIAAAIRALSAPETEQ